MPNYVIHVAKPAEKQIRRLDKKAQRIVIRALERLESNPRPPKSEKIGGHPPFLRIRASSYRIIYAVENRAVIILRVRSRKNAYEGLDNLNPQLHEALVELAHSTLDAMPPAGSA